MDYVAVKKYFIRIQNFVTFVEDMIFVNGVTFLITMTHGIHFLVIEHIPTHTAKELSESLKRAMTIYSRGGMILKTVLMDMEFDNTINELMGNVVVNTSVSK